MKKLTLATLILTIFACSAYAVEVEIPDANLEAVIRDKLNKPSGAITDADLESITELDSKHGWNTPDEDKIADLTGLEYCTNLTELNLGYNQITDISPLTNLTNLTWLRLYRNQISDISPLSNLIILTRLDLDDNQLTDISPLSNLTNLTGLYLHANQIKDISPLTNLTKLGDSSWETLILSNNQIRDLQPLVDNPGIDSGDDVEVRDNPLSYISQKTHIPTLEERGVDVIYYAKGTVSLDSAGPPTWSYTLTYGESSDTPSWQNAYIYNFSYEGAGITDASVTGEAEATGWTVDYQDTTRVTFANDTPLTEGSVSGFEITGTQGGTGSWLCGRGSGDIDGSLPVEMSSFTALTARDGVRLKWRTESETNNLGFNVYRSENKEGNFTKINGKLIKGAGTSATPHTYSFTDETAKLGQTYYYYIEDTDYSGKLNKSHILEVTVGQEKKVDLLPKETVLMQNYPNPGNPETWIPFKLSDDAHVAIFIYDIGGQLVRKIGLGDTPAGMYLNKDKAVYWNGKNSVGEKVSSGTYFYTLQADDYSATKRMLILK